MTRERVVHELTILDDMLKRKTHLDRLIMENQKRQDVTPSFMPLSKDEKLPTNNADTYLHEQLDILCKKKLFVTAKGRYKLEDSIRSTREFQDKVEQDHRNIAENRRREREKHENYEQGIADRTVKLKEELQLYIKERETLICQIENTNVLHPNDFPKIGRIIEKLKSFRADTIKEALQQCDAEDRNAAESKAESEWRIAQQRMMEEEEMRRLREQREHQTRVEKELEKQTKAIEDAIKGNC